MKKVLAWAVALALVLSSFTMAFAADAGKTSKDFSDADQIHYTEAVDVMVATGIINGFPDGTFGPQKTVKRSEMAKMIACIMNGGEDIGDQYKSACPFADSKDHWAAGYIAYCASEHIIDGRSADVFDPEATVTGTEVAKMALTSLGYDSKIQGYTGENWAAAVLKDAKKNDLFKDLDSSFVPGDPCDRESAAQILFNMLKATEVEYKNGTSVSVGDDVSVVVNAEIQNVKDKDGKDLPLYKDVFGGKLALDPTKKADDFGRPAHAWTYPDKKTEVGTYPDSSDYEFFAENTDLQKAIEAYDEDLAKDLYKKEGQQNVYAISYYINNGEANQGTIGLGDKVELFVTEPKGDDPGVVKAVVTQYTPYLITEVSTEVSKTHAKDNVKAYVNVTQAGKSGEVQWFDKDIVNYDASTYVKDAVIAVALKADGKTIIDSYVMKEAANGSIAKIYGTAPSYTKVTIDGKDYDVATGFKTVDGKELVSNEDATFALYDYNGYVLASVQGKEAVTDEYYGVVTTLGEDTATFGEKTKYVKIFTAEGEKTIAVSEDFIKATGTNAYPYPREGEIHQGAVDPAELVAYTLEEDKLASIGDAKPAPGTLSTTGAKMQNESVLAGKTVSKDVVAFFYDDKTDANNPKWVAYGFEDLNKDGVTVKADKVIYNADGEIVALMLTADVVDNSTEAIVGFVIDSNTYTSGKDTFTEFTAFVNGKEETFTAKNKSITKPAVDQLVVFTVNSDNELTAIEEARKVTDKVTAPFEFDKKTYDAAAIVNKPVVAKKNSSVDIGTAGDTPEESIQDFQDIGSAVIYYVNDEGKLEVSSIGQISTVNEAKVTLYQTDSSKQIWNIVVFTDKASKLTPAPLTPAP